MKFTEEKREIYKMSHETSRIEYKRELTEGFKFSDNFLRMTFPISDQANDQVNDQADDQVGNKELMLNKLASEILQSLKEEKKPSEKQLLKYIELAMKFTPEQIKILHFAVTPKSNTELQETGLGLQKHNENYKRHIEPLIVNGSLRRTLPKVPNSPLQKYFTTEQGKIILYIDEHIIQS